MTDKKEELCPRWEPGRVMEEDDAMRKSEGRAH